MITDIQEWIPEENSFLIDAREFMQEWAEFGVHYCCMDSCEDFINFLEKNNQKGEIWTWEFSKGEHKNSNLLDNSCFPWKNIMEDWYFHAVVKVGDFIYDWSARQFNPNEPFPKVWRILKETK